MAPPNYTRATERFRIFGIDLNSPVDALRPGYAPILENVRSYQDGVIESRQGVSVIASVSSTNKTPVHSIRRLNDPNTGNYQRIIGVQDTLSFGTTSFTRATYNSSDVSLSGNPLSLIPYRPEESPSSWMYIGDSTAMRKILGNNSQSITVGTVHQIGVAAPTNPPTITLGPQSYGLIQQTYSLGSSPNHWEVDGTVISRATNPTLIRRIPASSVTGAPRYDDNRTSATGAAGWCSIAMAEAFMAVAGIGQVVWVTTAGPTVTPLLIHEVMPGSASTTVGSILYENSPTNTGLCVIQPAKPLKEIKPNAVVLLNGATYARVIDIINGPNETFSFTTHTGSTTISATQTLAVQPCIRVYDPGVGLTFAGGDPVTEDVGTGSSGAITATGAGTSSFKSGWLQIVPASVLDLTTFAITGLTTNSNVAVSDDDYFHTAFRFSDLSNLTQGRIMFDVDNTSLTVTGATNATPIVITTSANHELADGDVVYITGVTGNTAANGQWFITRVSATTFSIYSDQARSSGVAGSGAYVNGGTVKPLFKKNFYYRTFTPNDLTTAAKGTDTSVNARTGTVQKRQLTKVRDVTPRGREAGAQRGFVRDMGDGGSQRNVTDPFRGLDPQTPPVDRTPDNQTTTGDFQWSELIFRRRDLVPVGELAERGRYHSCNAVRVEVTLSNTNTFWFDINSITVFGGYELDITELDIPYIYRYRYRVSNTGARSNWSPSCRSGATPKRGTVAVTVAAPSNAPEVDKIDIQRLGGISTNWLDVGTTTTSSLTFTDKVSDLFAIGSAPFAEDDTNYQPWPTLDVPFSTQTTSTSTSGSVHGSYFVTATALPTNLAKGTPMRVNGIDTTFRRTVTSTSTGSGKIYEIEDSLGTLAHGTTIEIPAPLITSQPLPVLWIHGLRAFAVGDNDNPGVLYYSNVNNPDGVNESNKLEITATSEPLMNGCSFNGKNYVWSTERMFEIEDTGFGLRALDVPGVKGLFARWALAVGERMWFLSRDGIYQTGGADCVSITDETLKPLFVKEGNVGAAVNGFNPPDFTQTSKLRLSYYDGYLYFIYQDTTGTLRCLTYTVRNEKPGWWPDTHLDGRGISYFYGEEGSGVHSLLAGGNDSTNGRLFQVTGLTDDTTGVACHVRTQAFDGGDRRALKHFGDLIVDADSQGRSITPIVYINNYSTSAGITPSVLSTSTAGRTQTIIDTTSGIGFEARNAALDLTWTNSTSTSATTPKLYLWEPAYIPLPETSKLRASYWDDCGSPGDKFFQGIKITTDTAGQNRTVVVEYDGGSGIGVTADTLTINHNGNIQKEYAFSAAFTAQQVRLRPTDANSWKNFEWEWVFQPEAPKVARYETQQTSHGYDGFIHLKSMFVNLASTGTVTLTITRTDDSSSSVYTIPTTAGAKRKVYVPLAVHKGKAFSYTFTATGDGFRLYKDTTDVYVKPWGANSGFVSRCPFGDVHGDGKAPI